MKKILFILIIAVSFMGCNKVPAGNVGVKFHLLGGDKGVDSEVLKPGRYWIGVNEELYLFPTFTQSYTWTLDRTEESERDESFTFQSSNGMSFIANVSVIYHLEADKVPELFQKYKTGEKEITSKILRTNIREAFNNVGGRYEAKDLIGAGKEKFMGTVKEYVVNKVGGQGIIIENISLVGRLIPPKAFDDAIARKIEADEKATQRELELRQTIAEAEKKREQAKGDADAILTKAKAQAQANRILSQSLTPSLVKYEAIQKWDGKMPKVAGSSAIPLIDLK